MRDYDFSLEACMESVEMSVKAFKENPFEQLGRSIIRAEQDPFFNKTMIEAWKKYIRDNNIKWSDKEVPAEASEEEVTASEAMEGMKAAVDSLEVPRKPKAEQI